jgi:hypothetical protein
MPLNVLNTARRWSLPSYTCSTDEDTEAERESDLPQVTQPRHGRTKPGVVLHICNPST